jgi:TP901 family phage tail tape measure protein
LASASASKEYKLAVKIAGSVSSSYTSAMSDAGSQMSNLGTIAKKAAAVAAAAWGALKIGQFISDAVDTYSEFEQAMANTSAIAGATADEYDQLEAAALAMGKATTKSASECAEALGYMSLAGWSVQESIDSLEPVLRLSEATQMDLATCSDLVTDSMSALGLQTSDLSSYLDIVTAANNNANTTSEALMEALIGCGGAAKTVGVSLLDTSTALGILANNGTKGSEAGTALNSILARISSNDSAIKALDALGVSAFDASGEFVGLQQFLEDTQGALANLSTEQQAYYLKQIAGTNYFTEMSYLLDSVAGSADGTATAWDTLADSLENSEGALDAMASSVTDTFEGAKARVSSAIDDLKINLVSGFAPYAKDALNTVAEYIPKITDKLIPMAQSFIDFALPKVQAFASGAMQLFQEIQPTLQSIGDKASEVFSFAVDTVGRLISNVASKIAEHQGTIDSLKTAAGSAMDSIGGIFENYVKPAINWVVDTGIPGAIDILLPLISKVAELASSILDSKTKTIALVAAFAAIKGVSVFTTLGTKISTVSKTLEAFQKVTNGASLAVSAATGKLPAASTAIGVLTGKIKATSLISEVFKTKIGAVTTAFKAIGSVIAANPIGAAVVGIVAVIAVLVTLYKKCEGFRNLVNTVASAVVGFVKAAASAIAGFFTDLWSKITSIWSTVSTWFQTNVITPLVNFFSPIVEWISSFFQGCWIIIQAVWTVVAGWFQTNVITPVVGFFSAIPGTISGFFSSLWTTVQSIWAVVAGWFQTTVIDPLVNFFSPIVETIGGFFSSLWNAICEVWQAAGTWFMDNVATPINNAFQAVSDFVKGVFNNLISFVESMLNSVISGINSFISGFNGIVSKAASVIGVDWSGVSTISSVSLPRFAEGGIVNQPTVLEAGEAGSEAIVPLSELWPRMQDMITGAVSGVADRVSALADRLDALDMGSSALSVSDLLQGFGSGSDDQPVPADGPVYQISYNPVYHFEGGTPAKEDLEEAEQMSQDEFNKKMQQWIKDNDRKRF